MPGAGSICVVGAGVFGAAAALELRRRGHGVTVLDPGPLPHPDAASTDVSKAVRMDYADAFYMDLMAATFPGWDAWNRRWKPPLYHEDGFLFLLSRPMRPGGFAHTVFEGLDQRGHRPRRLDGPGLRAGRPALAPDTYVDGYFNPRAGWAESGPVVARLLREAAAAGAVLAEGQTMARLREDGGRITGVITTEGREWRADQVLVAAGAWTPTLLPHLADRLWATGQPVFHFRPADPADFRPPRLAVWGADFAETGWYGFPALSDGTVKVANHGAGRPVAPDAPRRVTPREEARCRAFLRTTFPALAAAPLVRTRLCLYCDSWDGDFYIDHDPDRPGLVVAAGGSGHGFKFAPMLGRLIADVVEGKPNPYAARFAWRARASNEDTPPSRK